MGILLATLTVACKKAEVGLDAPVSPLTGTRTQFTLDSIYLYAKQVYLWSNSLPAYKTFDPRAKYTAYASADDAFNTEVFDISQIAINPSTTKPYELPVNAGVAKYSYLTGYNGSSGGGQAAVVAPSLDAILKDTIIDENIAYVALGSFPKLSTCKKMLDAAFANLGTTNPTRLVIDLRYNGGGYVETAEYIANLIAPGSLTGKVMFTEQYNTLLSAGDASILKNQTYYDASGNTVIYKGRTATMADVDYTETGNTHMFAKTTGFETVKDIYFITSGSTASASELLISVMKPYFNVRLVGGTTYGKPVGFFSVKVDVYSVYLSGFLIRNAAGWSDYFEGMPPDVEVAQQEGAALGDPTEACLKATLGLINGSWPGLVQQQAADKTVQTNTVFKSSPVNVTVQASGMIENRFKLKSN
ncbi:Peptidase family S41 [Mucilaginibacter gossypiicola]|uniref:Peptidase family S41 n=2 Tax=Mucilaginibacter gossypiicola TaxID=551995 RepID=A0A1H8SYJ4_9SPHI|nr:Peptidase family S41 [Mucilaginibacter gossypiicola]